MPLTVDTICWTWENFSMPMNSSTSTEPNRHTRPRSFLARSTSIVCSALSLGSARSSCANCCILPGIASPRAGAGDWHRCYPPLLHPHEHLGACPYHLLVTKIEIIHVRAGVDLPERCIDREWIFFTAHSILRERTAWKMSPAAMCSFIFLTDSSNASCDTDGIYPTFFSFGSCFCRAARILTRCKGLQYDPEVPVFLKSSVHIRISGRNRT